MRHQRNTTKLKRTAEHREALMANLACSLIEHEQITTTLAKAKALRPFAEKLVTLGKKGTLHARRLAVAKLKQNAHWEKVKSGKRVDHAKKLFEAIAPAAKERQGGYTRILKLQNRLSDSAPMAIIEWVDRPSEGVVVEVASPAAETKSES
jgi:large subunit ribosomal protein L17